MSFEPERIDRGQPPPPDWLRSSVSGVASAGVFLVLASGLFATLASVFLLLRYRRQGLRQGLVASLAGLIATPALAPVVALIGRTIRSEGGQVPGGLGAGELVLAYAAVAVAPALLIEMALRRTGTAARALELAIVGYLVLGALLLLVAGLAMEGGIAELVRRSFEESLDRLTDTSQRRLGQGGFGADDLALMEAQVSLARSWGPRLFPSLVAGGVIVGMWMDIVYLRWFTGGATEKDDLTTWRLPMWVMYALMACIAGMVLQLTIGESLPGLELLAGVSWNGFLLLGVLFWLQGVAALNYWFLRLSPSPILRMVGFAAQVLVMVYPPTSILFGVLGLTDAWFDLRKLDGPGEPSGEEG